MEEFSLKRSRLLLSLLVFPLASCQWDAKFLAMLIGSKTGPYGVSVEEGVALKTSDSTILRADIYHPKIEEPKPTVLVRIPFSNSMKNRFFSTVIGKLWASHGYHVVFQGTRGRYKSEGKYYPLSSERQDGLDTLAWLGKQPWYDGHLGTWGGSYFGYTQWVLADQTNPGPSALMVQLASTNFYEMFYPGGAFSLESALVWALWSTEKNDQDTPPETLQRGYEGFPLIQADDRARTDIPFFNDWLCHPQEDIYWNVLNVRDNIRFLKAPVLMMAGWYDPFLPSQLKDYGALHKSADPDVARKSRLIIGPWGHARSVTFPKGLAARNYRLESLSPTIPWFGHQLQNQDESAIVRPPVRIFVMGRNIWREENEWPLSRAKYTPYYLRSHGEANTLNGDGVLTESPPTSDEASDTYLYDPRDPVPSAGGAMIGPRFGIKKQNKVESRGDVLVYSTDPLQKDLEITGPVRLMLFVLTTAPNTDFTAKLVDVYPDGSAYNVCNGILRQSYPFSSSPVEIPIDLWPTSMVFFKGHRLRLEVSSSDYPRYDRNPNTGGTIATETNPVSATQTVTHRPGFLSRLILPVVE